MCSMELASRPPAQKYSRAVLDQISLQQFHSEDASLTAARLRSPPEECQAASASPCPARSGQPLAQLVVCLSLLVPAVENQSANQIYRLPQCSGSCRLSSQAKTS